MPKKSKFIPNTVEVELPSEPVVVEKKKKVMTDKQRENLAKGMAILKAKREAKSKAVVDEPEEVAPLMPPAPPPAPAPAPAPAPPPVPAPAPEVRPVKERKPRVVKNYLTKEDFSNELASLKSELLNLKSETVSVVKEVVPKVQNSVVKERLVTGSELLNKIFNL